MRKESHGFQFYGQDTGQDQDRPDHPGTVPAWFMQLWLIERAWAEITSLYGDRLINVIRPGPSYLDREEIFSRIFP